MNNEVIPSEPLYPSAISYDPPSRKLALGILLQALRDIVSPRRYKWKADEDWQADALLWFESAEDSPGGCSWVCQHLHIDASRLQGWLARYRSSDLTEKRRMAQELVRFQMPSSV